jgi:hypothetical protein
MVETFFSEHPDFQGLILAGEDPQKVAGPMAGVFGSSDLRPWRKVVEVRELLGANMAFREAVVHRVKHLFRRVASSKNVTLAFSDNRLFPD